MDILNNINRIIYVTNDGKYSYSGCNILLVCNGNLEYAQNILNRLNGQKIETLINQDLDDGRLIEFEGQYIMTYGFDVEIFISSK